MRSTLSILLIIVFAMVITPAYGDLNWSAGVGLTERESSLQMGSRIEALSPSGLVGAWFSSMGAMPILVQGLDYNAYLDVANVRNIRKVVMSPDKGKTEWTAQLVEGKGYQVAIPSLPVGAYGLEWGVVSKDKDNRMTLIVIPVNWTSRRGSAAVNQVMVQMPPLGCESFTNQEWFAYLRGFVPVWASPDPSILAQQQMFQNEPGPRPTAEPEPEMELPPPTAPMPEPEVKKPCNFDGDPTLVLVKDGKRHEYQIDIKADVSEGDILTFRRQGKVTTTAKVAGLIPGRYIEADVISGGDIRTRDTISVEKG